MPHYYIFKENVKFRKYKITRNPKKIPLLYDIFVTGQMFMCPHFVISFYSFISTYI